MVATAALVVLAGLWVLADPAALGAHPATCLPTGCFCERVAASGSAQPANAWSSLAFLPAAVGVAIRARGMPAGIPERVLSWGLGAALLAVGIGSLALHATLSYAGQLLDLQGMYLVALILGVGAVARSGRLAPAPALAWTVGGVVLLAASQYLLPGTRRWLFAVVLGAAVVAEIRGRGWSRPLRAGLLTLAVAYAVWLADDRQWLCAPTSWWQGHALWHLLTALAGFLLVEHYAVTSQGRALVRR